MIGIGLRKIKLYVIEKYKLQIYQKAQFFNNKHQSNHKVCHKVINLTIKAQKNYQKVLLYNHTHQLNKIICQKASHLRTKESKSYPKIPLRIIKISITCLQAQLEEKRIIKIYQKVLFFLRNKIKANQLIKKKQGCQNLCLLNLNNLKNLKSRIVKTDFNHQAIRYISQRIINPE